MWILLRNNDIRLINLAHVAGIQVRHRYTHPYKPVIVFISANSTDDVDYDVEWAFETETERDETYEALLDALQPKSLLKIKSSQEGDDHE